MLRAAAAVVGLGLTSLVVLRRGYFLTHLSDVAVAWSDSTVSGDRKSVTLPDGSHAELAADSRVRYVGTRAGRQLLVQGEAYLSIVHDPGSPLVLHAGSAVVRDVGTRLLVRAYPKDSVVRVLVTEGAVALRTSAAGEQALRAGTLGVVAPSGQISVTRAADTASYLGAWSTGLLTFHNVPVPEVVSSLGQWYNINIAVTDPALAHRVFRGSLTATNTDDALETLARVEHAEIEHCGRGVVLRATRSSWPGCLSSPSPQ